MPSFLHRVRPTERPSDRKTVRPCGRSAAFTLIEVMVATAIMVIMVFMVGSVFQQSSSAWDAGYARAEGGMAVRTVVGSLTRDLATAVDGRRFGMSAPVEVSGGSLKLVRLGSDGSFEEVEYTLGDDTAKRKSSRTEDAELYHRDPDSPYHASFWFSSRQIAEGKFPLRDFEEDSDFPGSVAWTVPYVKVRCELKREGLVSGLYVRSLGRDGIPNDRSKSDDDIIVR